MSLVQGKAVVIGCSITDRHKAYSGEKRILSLPFRLAGVRNKPPPCARSNMLARVVYLSLGDLQVLSWPTAQFLYQ
ncbi:hypothetical protein M405DRAFT_809493 [Rhizopogon salebrosus TDB-379]|nr:hypothetical protein M405DRAFT_809493 [Rhizopogon salebrosus TDB-379]